MGVRSSHVHKFFNHLIIYTMNKLRRKQLQEAIELLEKAKEIIELAKDEEQECFDNMPEGIQYSEKGEQIETNASDLDDVFNELESQIDSITDIIER